MTRAPAVHGQPAWVARYRWPEPFRFKHLLRLQPFGLYGRTYVRLSARRYAPCDVHINGTVTIHSKPVRRIDSINVPVRVGALWRYGQEVPA